MLDKIVASTDLQITIPKAVASAANWSSSQEFALVPREGGSVMVSVPDIDDHYGLVEGADTSK